MGKEHPLCLPWSVGLAVEEGRDRDTVAVGTFHSLCWSQQGIQGMLGSAAPTLALSLLGSQGELRWVVFFFVALPVALEQTWGEAHEGGNPGM